MSSPIMTTMLGFLSCATLAGDVAKAATAVNTATTRVLSMVHFISCLLFFRVSPKSKCLTISALTTSTVVAIVPVNRKRRQSEYPIAQDRMVSNGVTLRSESDRAPTLCVRQISYLCTLRLTPTLD